MIKSILYAVRSYIDERIDIFQFWCSQVSLTPRMEEFNTKGQCDSWSFRLHWQDAQNVSITEVLTGEQGHFGMLSCLIAPSLCPTFHLGPEKANVLDGDFENIPLIFKDKQVISVNIPDAFLEGGSDTYAAIPFTYCEVYAPQEHMTKVVLEFMS